jgi:glycosyltransferase involved in cell wall biosynthesis
MHILHISAADVNNAAGVLVYDLHKEFQKVSRSTLLIKKTDVKSNGVISYLDNRTEPVHIKKTYSLFSRVYNKIERLFKTPIPYKLETDPDYYFFDSNPRDTLVNVDEVIKMVGKPDIIIAYFMQRFFSINDLYKLQQKTGAPVLLYFADMAYLTGGCHYAWNCMGYKNECLNCPAIININEKVFAHQNLILSEKIIKKMNIIPVVGSTQLYDQVRESTLFKNKRIEKILVGIDSSILFKKEKNLIREKYNIPAGKFVILFGAVSQTEKRKGIRYLYGALEYLKGKVNIENILLLSIGNRDIADNSMWMGYGIIKYGYIEDFNTLSDMYNLANVFVSASIQDSGPMMINQSIACGTPVVCFNIGVSSDLVINKKTGYTAELYNSESLAEGIKTIYELNRNEYEVLSQNSIELAAEKINLTNQVKKFMILINDILN